MPCQRFREAIAHHAGGAELDRETAAHLAACERCRTLLEMQRQLLAEIDEHLKRSLDVCASPELAGQVTKRVQTRERRHTPLLLSRPTAVWSGLAAAAAVAAFFVGATPRTRVQPATGRGAVSAIAPQPTAPSSVQPAPASARAAVGPAVPSRPAPRERRRSAAGGDPPVIVDPTQALAIARLLEAVTAGRLREPFSVLSDHELGAELSIAPLQVDPIKVPEVDIVNHPPAVPQRH